MSLFSLVLLGMMPFGNLLIGALANVIGTPVAVGAAGAGLGATVLAIAAGAFVRDPWILQLGWIVGWLCYTALFVGLLLTSGQGDLALMPYRWAADHPFSREAMWIVAVRLAAVVRSPADRGPALRLFIGQQPGFAADVEGESSAQLLLEAGGAPPRQRQDLGVGGRRQGLVLVHRLRQDRDRDRPVETVVEVAHEPLAHPEELVGQVGSHGDADAGLETLPEVSKISLHDHQPA